MFARICTIIGNVALGLFGATLFATFIGFYTLMMARLIA